MARRTRNRGLGGSRSLLKRGRRRGVYDDDGVGDVDLLEPPVGTNGNAPRSRMQNGSMQNGSAPNWTTSWTASGATSGAAWNGSLHNHNESFQNEQVCPLSYAQVPPQIDPLDPRAHLSMQQKLGTIRERVGNEEQGWFRWVSIIFLFIIGRIFLYPGVTSRGSFFEFGGVMWGPEELLGVGCLLLGVLLVLTYRWRGDSLPADYNERWEEYTEPQSIEPLQVGTKLYGTPHALPSKTMMDGSLYIHSESSIPMERVEKTGYRLPPTAVDARRA